MILFHLLEATDVVAGIGLVEQVAEIETLRFPMCDSLPGFQSIHATDHFLDRAEAELRHQLAHLHRDEAHEVDGVLRLAGVSLAQTRILRRNARGAGVEMTHAHHDAACRNQRSGREAEFFRAEQRSHHHVATRLQLTVGFDRDTAAQVVHHERLVSLGEAKFPRQTGVHDGSLR